MPTTTTTRPPPTPTPRSRVAAAAAAAAAARFADVARTAAPGVDADVDADVVAFKAAREYVGVAEAKRARPDGAAGETTQALVVAAAGKADEPAAQSRAMQVRRRMVDKVEAKPHPKWKLDRVVQGHNTVPRCVAVDVSNQVFATGDSSGEMRVWDVATTRLKYTFKAQHSHTVRGLAFSPRHAYLYSCAEDKEVRCFDLETKQVVRAFRGHTAGVYAMALHPTLDLIISGGRDKTVRVWDARSGVQAMELRGHTSDVSALLAEAVDPQVISGSEDTTIRLWDLAAGKSMQTLTHHTKGVRALALNPEEEFSFVSGATGSVKKFALPEGRFMMDMPALQRRAYGSGIVHCLAAHRDVLVAGTDTGALRFWDWASGDAFQDLELKLLPGSLESENYVTAAAFDVSGSLLMTCHGDKTIRVFSEAPVQSSAS